MKDSPYERLFVYIARQSKLCLPKRQVENIWYNIWHTTLTIVNLPADQEAQIIQDSFIKIFIFRRILIHYNNPMPCMGFEPQFYASELRQGRQTIFED